MGFAPDYGLKLRSLRGSDDSEVTFIPFVLLHICINPFEGLCSSTVDVELCGEPHALTLDFDAERFKELLAWMPTEGKLANNLA